MRRLTHRTTLEILEQKRLLAGDLVRFDTKDDTAAEVRFGDDDGFELVAARRDRSSDDNSDDRDDSDDSSRDDASETLYVAALQGPGPGHGKVEYEVDTDDSPEIEFELEVEDAVPGSSHVVTVDGVTIGTLQINSFGRGEWKLTSRVDDADEQPLPANFPALQAGSVITVGSILQGELRQRLIAGDMNDDNQLDADDVDSLFAAMRDDRRNDDDRYDIDRNGVLNQSDIARYVQLAFDSVIGDTNLDGVFNSSDLIAIFQLGHYEDEIRGNSGWSSGDWNGDGDCDSSDLVFAFQQGGYRA
jgi:hypothetical protein